MNSTIGIFIISFGSAFLLLGAIKLKVKKRFFLLLGLLPLVFIYLWSPNNRIVSDHGFWHTSIVYQIMNGNIPPNNPLLAGKPLIYPWATHLVVAALSNFFQISPPITFALINLSALLMTMILAVKITKFFSHDRIINIFAVFLSIFGITFFVKGPIAQLLKGHIPLSDLKSGMPIFLKFGQVNSTHLGILFFSLFLYSVLHIFIKPTKIKHHSVTLFISVLGAVFFYPFYWLAILACCFSICLVMFLVHGKIILPKIAIVCACVVTGSLVGFPYLLQISSGKSDAASSLLMASPLLALKHGYTYFLTTLPISTILVWKRKILRDYLSTKSEPILIVVTSVITTTLMYVFLSGPLEVEYKYAMLSYFSLGIISSVCFADLYHKNRLICFILTASFLLPFSTYMAQKVKAGNSDYSYILERRAYLRHSDPGENRLYSWISNHTDRNAIFIDSNNPNISLFGRRQVYYGQLVASGLRYILGWYGRYEFLGYSHEMTEARKKIVEKIYSNSNSEISAEVVSAIAELDSKSGVYVVVRKDKTVKEKFVNNNRFNQVFDSSGTKVYQFSH